MLNVLCSSYQPKTRATIKCDTSAAASRSAAKPIHVWVLCFSSGCIKYEIKNVSFLNKLSCQQWTNKRTISWKVGWTGLALKQRIFSWCSVSLCCESLVVKCLINSSQSTDNTPQPSALTYNTSCACTVLLSSIFVVLFTTYFYICAPESRNIVGGAAI